MRPKRQKKFKNDLSEDNEEEKSVIGSLERVFKLNEVANGEKSVLENYFLITLNK